VIAAHVGGLLLEEIAPSVTGAGARLAAARLADAAPAPATGDGNPEMTDNRTLRLFDAWTREEMIAGAGGMPSTTSSRVGVRAAATARHSVASGRAG
jgi:hypothetical protein